MCENEKNSRYEIHPPTTERRNSRSYGFVTDPSESDIIERNNPTNRSPRRKHYIKSYSSRTNKNSIKPSNSNDDYRKMESDIGITGTFSMNMNPAGLKHHADSGNAMAQYLYGLMLLEGKEIPMDISSALKYFKESADSGNADACCKYSLTLLANRESDQDLKTSINYLEKAANLGNAQGQYEYGRLLVLGKQVQKNIKLGYGFIQKAADQGYVPAQIKYAKQLMHGSPILPQDIKKGIKYLKFAAKSNSAEAMNMLGQLYERGDVVNQNYAKAVSYFKEAAKLGNPEAQNSYGTILLRGEYGKTAKPQKALQILEKAAAQNNPIALYNIGMHLTINGTKEQQQKGVTYLRKSAALGYDRAQYNMGIIYEKGQLLPQDLIQAARYYEKAALKGDMKAQCNYAAMLAAGKGVDKDEQKAMDYFKLSADQGNTISQFRYAQMLEQTQTMALYRSEIVKYYLLAAESGYPRAQFCAAKYLELNDRPNAKRLYSEAANNGIDEALYRLGCLMQLDGEDYLPTMKKAAEKGDVDAKIAVAMYAIEYGTEQEKKEALETFKKAAETGHSVAKYNYGAALLHINRKEGMRYLKEAADEENILAQLKYGQQLKEDRNFTLAFKYLDKAANQGNADAQYECALMLEKGEGCQKSQQAAYDLIEQAAKGGNKDAQFRYSEMLENGINALKSHSDSLRYLKYSADNGHQRANLIYARVLLEQNLPEAFQYAKRAALMKNPEKEALLIYGKLLRNGFGTKRDVNKSVEQLKKAAELGSKEAYFLLGNMLLDNEYCEDEDDEEENEKKAEDYLIKAADKGHKKAMLTLAEYYDTKEEKSKANHFYRLSAEAGENEGRREYAIAMLAEPSEKKKRIGDIYLRNAAAENELESEYMVSSLPDVEKTKEGKRLLELAALGGHPKALLRLASTSSSPITLLESAASSGSPDALYALGQILAQVQPIRAPAYLQAAAKKGYAVAYLTLAELSNNEIDAKNNLKSAYEAKVPGAEAKLGRLYEATQPQKAELLYKKGSSKGEPEAMYRYALILRKKDPDSQEARSLLIRAANQNIYEAKLELAKELRSKGELSDALNFYKSVARHTGDKKAIEAVKEITKELGPQTISDDLHKLMTTKAVE